MHKYVDWFCFNDKKIKETMLKYAQVCVLTLC